MLVSIEPHLQPLSGEALCFKTANSDFNARLDIAVNGFWGERFERSFFDVRVVAKIWSVENFGPGIFWLLFGKRATTVHLEQPKEKLQNLVCACTISCAMACVNTQPNLFLLHQQRIPR